MNVVKVTSKKGRQKIEEDKFLRFGGRAHLGMCRHWWLAVVGGIILTCAALYVDSSVSSALLRIYGE